MFGYKVGCSVASGSACSLPAMPASSKASRVEQNLLCRSQAPSHVSCLLGLEEKNVLSKKEKMKLRKERWLQSEYSCETASESIVLMDLCTWVWVTVLEGAERFSKIFIPPQHWDKSFKYCFSVFSTKTFGPVLLWIFHCV